MKQGAWWNMTPHCVNLMLPSPLYLSNMQTDPVIDCLPPLSNLVHHYQVRACLFIYYIFITKKCIYLKCNLPHTETVHDIHVIICHICPKRHDYTPANGSGRETAAHRNLIKPIKTQKTHKEWAEMTFHPRARPLYSCYLKTYLAM